MGLHKGKQGDAAAFTGLDASQFQMSRPVSLFQAGLQPEDPAMDTAVDTVVDTAWSTGPER